MKFNQRLFKGMAALLLGVTALCGSACAEQESSYTEGGAASGSYAEGNFRWEKAGKGCGAYIPEPIWEYEINASSTYISAEVHNITESDFYSYANTCIDRGFDGEIGAATSPDLYLMAYNAERYYLEVMYYEDESYFSIYIRPPQNN